MKPTPFTTRTSFRNFFKADGGFTLIEMLIVIAILGILTSIALPAIANSREEARAVAKAALINQIQTAKNRYALDNQVPALITWARFSEFKPYINVNGITPGIEELSTGSLNGTGENITRWGLYPRVSSTGIPNNGTIPIFSTTLPPILGDNERWAGDTTPP